MGDRVQKEIMQGRNDERLIVKQYSNVKTVL